MRQWRQVEELFLQVPYQLYVTFNMKFWIWFWYLLIMFGGSCEWLLFQDSIWELDKNEYFFVAGEHVLLVFNSFQKSDLERRQCNLNVSYWETLYGRERPHLSMVIPFQYWTLPIYEVSCRMRVSFCLLEIISHILKILSFSVAQFNPGLSPLIYRCFHYNY